MSSRIRRNNRLSLFVRNSDKTRCVFLDAQTDIDEEEKISRFFPLLFLQLNVHQRPLGQICPAAGGSVPQGQQSSAGSVGSAPSPASPRPTPQPRPPVASTASQPSRTLDDDRSTDGELELLLLLRRSKLRTTRVIKERFFLLGEYLFREISVNPDKYPLSNWLIAVGTGTAAEDSDDGESIAQYVSTNCVVFTHYRGDAASEVEEHFQRALAHDKPKGELSKNRKR